MKRFRKEDSGQGMVEAAAILPFLLFVALNLINFAYFFYKYVNIIGASRDSAQYAVTGFQTPNEPPLPALGSSADCTTQTTITGAACSDLAGNVVNPATNSTTGMTTPTDPEPHSGATQPLFLARRVTIDYTFSPLIPGPAKLGPSMLLSFLPGCSGNPVTCTIHSEATMRVMN
jgi:Flp pilus assembly protein TadG